MEQLRQAVARPGGSGPLGWFNRAALPAKALFAALLFLCFSGHAHAACCQVSGLTQQYVANGTFNIPFGSSFCTVQLINCDISSTHWEPCPVGYTGPLVIFTIHNPSHCTSNFTGICNVPIVCQTVTPPGGRPRTECSITCI